MQTIVESCLVYHYELASCPRFGVKCNARRDNVVTLMVKYSDYYLDILPILRTDTCLEPHTLHRSGCVKAVPPNLAP